jgi:WD40 repeat protein
VSFNHFQGDLLIAVSDDKSISVYDMRCDKVQFSIDNAHDAEIMCLDCYPFQENFILTGSMDTTVKLWDMRQP